MYNGYNFYIDGMKLPIAPPSLTITVGSKNETVDLINGGEINILKSPALIEVSFEARFPMRNYPYAPQVNSFDSYYSAIKELKENKKPFIYIVSRTTPSGVVTWDTNLTMALESFTLNEDWEEGDDVLIEFELKQYKSYGTKTVKVSNGNQVHKVPEATNTRTEQTVTQTTYVIKSGDRLYTIAQRHYGDSSRWRDIYAANKSVIEDTAKKRGLKSSSNGHWIFPGTEIVLPAK